MTTRYRITIDGVAYDVEVGDILASPVRVLVDGEEFEVEVPDAPTTRQDPTHPDPSPRPRPARPRPVQRARPSAAANDGSQDVIRAPMPGRIIRVNVSAGDGVERGQALLVLESMKMENTIAAPRDGVVSQVHVAGEDSVQHGQSLVELE